MLVDMMVQKSIQNLVIEVNLKEFENKIFKNDQDDPTKMLGALVKQKGMTI